jgi:NADH:ubiquinone oxidoreductase subunit 6 (subunit J)
MSADAVALAAVSALMLGGAIGVVLVRDVMRLVVALGVFLLGVAGLYLYEGLALLATAQVFLYVGGVLVLLVFAVMVVHRTSGGRVEMATRHDVGSLAIAVGVSLMIGLGLSDVGLPLIPEAGSAATAGPDAAGVLLGGRIVVFELAGALLLAALVAVLVIVGGRDER